MRKTSLKKKSAWWTYCPDARAYYFRPSAAAKPPYLRQIQVEAIIDVAADGTLAGIEIIDTKAPPPPE